MLLAVAGCVAQAEGELLVERAPFVDIVVGPQAYHRLPELLARRAREPGAVIDTDFPVESKFDRLPQDSRASGVSAFLTIQEGCDKFCSFCVVPYTRGAEQSRPAADVLREARGLVASGARELTLLGQNVNAYHGAGPDGRQLGPRTADPGAGGDPGARADPLHDLASARHGPGPDPGAWRGAAADAVPASAGAVRLGRDPRGDEPQAYRPATTGA